jgi:hypothetical protein
MTHARKEKEVPKENKVYVVSEVSTGIPLAAFTVKVEMQVWLYGHEIPELVHLRLWELRDSAYWLGKTPEPFPLDVLYQYHEGEKVVTQRTIQNKSWE